jgi:predicted  nucleic acid-binding Zn-ribbon protein
MSTRDLKVLIELQDNFKQRQELKALVDTQVKRIDHVKNQIDLKQEELTEFQEDQKSIVSSLNENENLLASKEKTLKQAQSHSLEVTSEKQANLLKKEIELLSTETEALEEKILEELDKSELIQKSLEETKIFLVNSEESLSEISSEANTEIAKQNKLIDDCLITKNQHIEVLTIQAKDLIIDTEKIFKEKDYFCSIDSARNCTRCGSNVDSETRETAEKQEQIMSCPSCRRLFVFR